MKFGTSLLSNKIYAGNTRINKDGIELWTKKTDVTDEVVKAVFEHMYNEAKKTGTYEVSIKGFGKMTFVREKKDGEK